MKTLALVLAFLPVPIQDRYTPADMIRLAAWDIVRVDPVYRPTTRYLDLSSIEPKEREKFVKVLYGHMQHISRATNRPIPETVDTGKASLLRIDLSKYYIDTKVWERLANEDPYYHFWPKHWYEAGKNHKAGFYWAKEPILAPWLTPTDQHEKDLKLLVAETYSKVPVVRADWFFNQTAAQENRDPGYYDFLGIKTLADFEKLIAFNKDDYFRTYVERYAAIEHSEVAVAKLRALEFRKSLTGWYRISYDYLKSTLEDKPEASPLRVLGRDVRKVFDAQEIFGSLANGFLTSVAVDNKGNLVDVVPANIAADHKYPGSNDVQIHPNVSCIRCHNKSGWKDVNDYIRHVASDPIGLVPVINSFYPKHKFGAKEIARFEQHYEQGSIKEIISKGRSQFDYIVSKTTGFKDGSEYCKAYGEVWASYENMYVDLDGAARLTGLSSKYVFDVLDTALKNKRGDIRLTGIIRGRPMPIEEFERSYHKLWEHITAYRIGQELWRKKQK